MRTFKINETKIYKVLHKDIKEFNSIILSILCISFLVGVGILSYKMNTSYAIFTDSIKGEKTLQLTVDTCSFDVPNPPVLSSNMIPVYYDEENEVWKKADEKNRSGTYEWYDYCEKKWANAVTVSDFIGYEEHIQSDMEVEIEAEKYLGSHNETSVSFSDRIVYYKKNNYSDYNIFYCCSTSEPTKDSITGNYYLSGNYYSADNLLDKYCSGGVLSTSDLSNSSCTGNSLSNVSKYTARTTETGSDSTGYYNSVYSGIEYSVNPTFIYEPEDYQISSNYSFDNTTGKYTLTNPEKSTYTSEHVGYYMCSDKTSTTCEEMYKITFVDDNTHTIFVADIYTVKTIYNENTSSYDVGDVIPLDEITTMFVWIPRYKYTVWNYNSDGTATSEPQEIDIEFESGTTTSGEIGCIDNIQGTSDGTASGTQSTTSEICTIKTTNEECTDSTCNGLTYTHPAFTFGDKELEGIWVGKFEASGDTSCALKNDKYGEMAVGTACNLTSIKPLVKPNITSWRGAMIGTFENNIMAMNDDSNIYGFEATDDTHMIKNIEWGAVTYLSHSKYGTCTDGECTEVALNSYNGYMTGCGPQSEGSTLRGSTCNAYNTTLGKLSSTTGNTYGIYDMSGGYEFVMGSIVSPDGETMMSGQTSYSHFNSGYTGIIYDSGNYTSYTGPYTYPDNKYYDKYSFNTDRTTMGISKLGDGIKEVYVSSYYSSYYGWYSNILNVPHPYDSRLFRSGDYRGGIFSSSSCGISNAGISTRLAITQ